MPSPCTEIDTGQGQLEFSRLESPVVSPDGLHVYVAITGIQDTSAPVRDRRGAVLHFTSAGGTLAYADCEGVVTGRIITFNDNGSVNQVYLNAVSCGDSQMDMRNLSRVQVSPDGASLYVLGAASDTQYEGDALTRLIIGSGGALAFDSCRLAKSGLACNPGQGVDYTYAVDEIQVSADSKDVYVNTHPPSHFRLGGGVLAQQADFTAPAQFYIDLLGGRRFSFDATGNGLYSPTSGSFGRISMWDRNPATGALTYRGCAASSYQNYDPGCDLIVEGYGGDYIAVANQAGALVTFGTGSAPGDTYPEGPFLTSFVQAQVLAVTPPTNGSIASSPGRISCGSICQDTFTTGTTVSLTATPATNYAFTGWTGDCTGTTNPCTITMSQARSAGATFAKIQYSMTISVGASGSVTSSPAGITNCTGTCSANFDIGTVITLNQTPSSGYQFSAWGGDCTGATSGGCVLSMNQVHSASISFSLVPAPPAAPTNLNAVVTATKVSKKLTTYSAALNWTDNSGNETGFIVQRFKTSKGKCVLESTSSFNVTLGADTTSYVDTSATSATCGYQVAATNSYGTSSFVRDLDTTTGIKP